MCQWTVWVVAVPCLGAWKDLTRVVPVLPASLRFSGLTLGLGQVGTLSLGER